MRTEDGSIISKCLNGEPEAFGLLVDKYKTGIYAYVYAKIRNFHDAQDVTQEVFIQAYRDLHNLRRWDSFVFWLYRIASAQCSKWQRTKSRHPDSEFIEDQDPQKLEAPSIDSYRENQMYEWLQDSLDSLPEAYREVLTLHYFAGMKSEEIARALGISPAGIRMRLSRARSQLREDMLAMMRGTFEQQRLPVTFTFRIVETIKHIKIQPISTIKGLPWGLSFVTGLIIVIMSLNPELGQLITLSVSTGFPLPVETKVLKIGEIPVDTVKVSQLAVISSEMGKGEKPLNQNAFLLAPQAEGGTWVKKSDMPTGVGYHSISMVNGKIYVIGGMDRFWDQNLIPFTSVYEYDPKADTWSKKADMLTPRSGSCTCVVDGKIYAIGGWSDGDFTNSVEAYDPITDKWEKKADMPTKRADSVVNQVNGKIYVIGGHDQRAEDAGEYLSIVEEYDPKMDTWTKKNDMPIAISFAANCVVKNKIYVISGVTNGIKPLASVEIYDPSTDTWTKGSDMPTSRPLSASCAVNGMIYVMGGIDGDGNSISLSTVEIYDPKNDKWTESENMPIARFSVSNYPVIDEKIYIIGGVDDHNLFLSDVWEYTPESLQSVLSLNDKLPTKWGEVRK
jgi:RNA polymerase sigma factor (sigma-70 family)